MNEFERGDTAMLRGSMNVTMSVGHVDGDYVECFWFNDEKLLIREKLHYKTLRRIKATK